MEEYKGDIMIEYKEIERTVEKQGTSLERETFKHPAFGMIGFSRVSGGENTLFGSSIKHNDRIVMTLKHGEQDRHLHDDWYYGRGLITEVEMSYSQFAECITAMNVGDGVPCTIRYTEKDGHIPAIVENNSKREQFRNEFSDTILKAMEQVQDQINEIQKSLDDKKSLGVKDRKEMISKLQQVKYNIGSNLDFCVEQFDEQMEKTTLEAKGEIEAFCQNKINSIAQAALVENREKIVELENPVEI